MFSSTSSPRTSWLIALGLMLAGGTPALFFWARFAATSPLYSYSLAIPFLCWFLAREKNPAALGGQKRAHAAAAGIVAVLSASAAVGIAHLRLPEQDAAALMGGVLVLSMWAALLVLFERDAWRGLLYPAVLLLTLVPFPGRLEDVLEHILQEGSADTAYLFFQCAGSPVYREGTLFHLPGITLEVAPQCSGIHSTLVLAVVSLLSGCYFLTSPWRRLWLALAVAPLALLRNGARVYVLGELSVRLGPEVLSGPLHRHGGPLFFALSLLPFGALLIVLKRTEQAGLSRKPAPLPLQTPASP